MIELISVIVPVYNVQTYLDRCIQSIVGQDYQNLEIILVENGSSDCSMALCCKWAEQDARIRVLSVQDNHGVSAARNLGMESARGDLWMFVDSDDYLPPDAVQILYDRMKEDKSDLVMGKHLHAVADGSATDKMCSWMTDCVLSPEEILENPTGQEFPVCLWGKLYRRSVWEEIVLPPLVCGEDLWVFPQILARCQRVSVTEQVVYFYFQHLSSVMHQKGEIRKKDEFLATMHMVGCVLEKGYLLAARRWLSRAIYQGMEISDRKAAKWILCQNLNAGEIKTLCCGMSLKQRILIVSMFIPGFFSVIQWITGRNRK